MAQISELQRQLDGKNSELVQLVNKESQLQATFARLVGDDANEKMETMKKQLDGFAMKKELLLTKMSFIEDEITKKRKEAGIL